MALTIHWQTANPNVWRVARRGDGNEVGVAQVVKDENGKWALIPDAVGFQVNISSDSLAETIIAANAY